MLQRKRRKRNKEMSFFTKVHMIHDKAYQDWKNHKCNENRIERMDILNKKYIDDISSSVDTSQDSGIVSNDTVDDVNADSELNAGVQDLNNSTETVDAEKSFVDDTSSMSNFAEVAISNPSNTNTSLNESNSLNNADTTTNSQHESQSTVLAANVAPPSATQTAPIVQSHTRGVYNCKPATTSTQGRTVIPDDQNLKISPYKCTFCPKSYQAKWGLKRHLVDKHSTQQVTPPTTTTPTAYNEPKLIEIDGIPANSNQIPLPYDDDFLPDLKKEKKTKLDLGPLNLKRQKVTNLPTSSRVISTRRRKRNDEADDVEQPPPKMTRLTRQSYRDKTHKGGNFYSSWD